MSNAPRFIRFTLLLLCAALTLTAATAPAQAARALIDESLLSTDPKIPSPPPEGQIEGACGLAVGPGGPLYVSDYYHRAIDRFSITGGYESQAPLGFPPEGPCGLALDSGGSLYANLWDQGVFRVSPTSQLFDPGHATGIAVDPATDYLYVNKRTFIAVYEPSGQPLQSGGEPLQIGLGTLEDAYGVTVFEGRVYVPDAADNTVKVYEPGIDPLAPTSTITGFNSLFNAAVTVDPTTGNLLVVDNLQPGYEHPKAAVFEYQGDGALLARLPGAPVHGEPSGIAVDPASGDLYVTSGNDEEANVFAYGPYEEVQLPLAPPPSAAAIGSAPATLQAPSTPVAQAPTTKARRARRHRNHRHRRAARLHAQTKVGGSR